MRKMSRNIMVVVFSIIAFTLILNGDKIKAANETKVVNIVATSDIHNRFQAYEYANNSVYANGGLTRISTFLNEYRTTHPNTVLIDNGDTMQDNSSLLFVNEIASKTLPVIKAMNYMGFDVWNSGNHEYNYGVDKYKKAIESFSGDSLVANVYEKGSTTPIAKPYSIIERDGVKIAVIGVVTPHIVKWDGPNLENYDVTNPYDEIQKYIDIIKGDPNLRSDDLADSIVISFHAGLDGEYGNDSTREVAERFGSKIDAIITGHAHQLVNEVINGVVVLEPSAYGQYVSTFDLNFEKDGAGYWNVVSKTGTNIKMSTYVEDPALVSILASDHNTAVTDATQVIGTLVNEPLAKANEIKGIPTAQLEDTPLIDLILKVELEKTAPYVPTGARHVASASIFDINSNVQVGTIIKADTAKIYKYDNTLMTVKITGADLKKYMEWSAAYYNKYNAGDLTTSFNPNQRLYNYDMFGGVSYQIYVSKDAGSRITNLKYTSDSVDVQDTDVIYLSANNYRVNTHLKNPLLGLVTNPESLEVVYDSKNEIVATVRDMIRDHIMALPNQTVVPSKDDNWSIVGNNWDVSQHNIIAKLVNTDKVIIPKSTDGKSYNAAPLKNSDLVANTKSVDLVSINDFHGAIAEAGKNIGAAKLNKYLKDLVANKADTVLLSSGDNYQGSAMSNLTKGKATKEIFDEAKIEFSALGNHEFDWGVDVLKELIKKPGVQGGVQYLAANLVYKSTQTSPDWVKPYAIVEKNGLKIGIIGITTPDTVFSTAAEHIVDYDFLNPTATANKYIDILRNQEHVDVVIALTHEPSFQKNGVVSGEAAELAKHAVGLDGIFSAHSHQFVDGDVNNVPVVQGGFNGRGVSKLMVTTDLDGNYIGTYGVMEELYKNVATMPIDLATKTIVDRLTGELSPIFDVVVGTTDELSHDTSNNVQVTPMGYTIAEMMAKIGNTDIAIMNGGGIRAGFEAGNITMGNMYTVFPFDNNLVTTKVTGAHLKELIKHGLYSTGFKTGQFYGVTAYYTYDANTNTVEITSMRLSDGSKVLDDAIYSVTTIDFIMTGGDQYNFTGATDTVNTNIPLRDKLVDYIKTQGHIANKFVNPAIQGPDTTVDVKPDVPVVSTVKVGDTTIAGTAVVDGVVTVTFDTGNSRALINVETTVSSAGTWSVNIPTNVTLKVGDIIKISVKSKGMVSDVVSITVQSNVVINPSIPGVVNPETSTPSTDGSLTKTGFESHMIPLFMLFSLNVIGLGIVLRRKENNI